MDTDRPKYRLFLLKNGKTVRRLRDLVSLWKIIERPVLLFLRKKVDRLGPAVLERRLL